MLSWTSKSATPSKTSWSQFESIDNGWHLKQTKLFTIHLHTYTYWWADHRATRVGRSTPACTNVHIEITLKSREWLLERKLNLITKMSTSNNSTITSLHDSHLHLWQSWKICCEHWLSPKFWPTGHWGRRKISTRLIWCEPSDPKLSQIKATSILNESP